MNDCHLTCQLVVRASGHVYSSCILLHQLLKVSSTVQFLAPNMEQFYQLSLTRLSDFIETILRGKMWHRAIYAFQRGRELRAIFWEEFFVFKLNIWERFIGFWTSRWLHKFRNWTSPLQIFKWRNPHHEFYLSTLRPGKSLSQSLANWYNNHSKYLPTPGEAKAKAMSGRLYTHNNNKPLLCPILILPERDVLGPWTFLCGLI